MSDLLKQPTNMVYNLSKIEHMKYNVSVDEEIVGTVICISFMEWIYENDRVQGTKETIGEAVRALYYSKLG